MTEHYEKLKEALPEMLELVEPLADALKPIVMEALLKAYLEGSSVKDASGTEGGKKEVQLPAIKDKEMPGIAKIDGEGKFHLIVRNPKGTSNNNAIMRIAYITIRAYEKLTEEKKIPRKIVNEALEKWRLYDGNARSFIGGDRGITKEGDQAGNGTLSLDEISRSEADQFIKDVSNEDVPAWTRKTGKPRGKKKGSKGEKDN